MNAILGMTELALDEELTPRLRDYLQTAKDSADMLLDLLDEILDFSRIETGHFQLETAPFSLRHIVEQTLKTMGIRAYEKGLELIADLPDDLPDQYAGDPLRLRQVLLNLVGNAIKFTKRGEVVVSVAEDERGPRDDGEDECKIRLQFAVKDSGIGIAPEDCRRIFAPFTQADASTTRSYGGTGLGLAICSSLVKLMGGRIWIESQPNRGSTFYFTVDLIRQPEAVAEPEESLQLLEQLQGLPVLIVSVSEATRRVLEQNLVHWGMKPEAVGEVPAALAEIHEALAAGRSFPLAIIDAVMPQIDGFTLAGWIKHDRRLAGAMILMTSTNSPQAHVSRCRELGAICLEKPILRSNLFKAVNHALGLTCVPPPAVEPAPVEKQANGERSLRILLAEDNVANQKIALYLLKKQGHDLEVTNNGREAVDMVSSRDFDVVLMDVQMPIMDGFQATAAIRALPNKAKAGLPIIAMTAHSMKGDKERCLAAGMDGYITKPISSKDLLMALSRVQKNGR
jgi:two-component system, sensor histidine kinase and response regulator